MKKKLKKNVYKVGKFENKNVQMNGASIRFYFSEQMNHENNLKLENKFILDEIYKKSTEKFTKNLERR